VPPGIIGDALRFRQIIVNLVSNAIKFTEQGEVIIRVSLVTEAVAQPILRCAISDTGIGIPKDQQHSIFEVFTQVDGSSTRRYGGTGLGLTLSKRLVIGMGGEIGVESVPGQGSTFWFTLPVTVAEGGSPMVLQADSKPYVLIASPHAIQCQILYTYLSSMGIVCEKVNNTASILEKLKTASNAFDMVILDSALPEVEKLTRAIKTDMRIVATRLVLLTAYSQAVSNRQLVGINAYLNKPIRKEKLYEAIQFAMQPHKRLDATKTIVEEAATVMSTKKILLVEDNIFNQKVALGILKKLGFDADVANNGQEAINMLSNVQYDVIFMDCQMPVMDGYQATQVIRQQEGAERHTPIIAMTANAMEGDRQRCLEATMDDYMSKPFKLQTLNEIVQRWLPQ
jgi:CheY-like chemotaxis protein